MKRPESNGLVEIAGGKPKNERGFACMRLIKYLTDGGMTDWEYWHGAHLQAAAGKCPYAKRCPNYARTIERIGKKPVQLTLLNNPAF